MLSCVNCLGVFGCGQDLFGMVAFILHLGNVTFDDDEGTAVISSDETLRVIDDVCTRSPCCLTPGFGHERKTKSQFTLLVIRKLRANVIVCSFEHHPVSFHSCFG